MSTSSLEKLFALRKHLRPEFKEYAAQVVKNCAAFADEMLKLGYTICNWRNR